MPAEVTTPRDPWSELPHTLQPHRFEQRRAWLLERVRAGDRVADIGAGDGAFAAALTAAGAEVHAVDISEAALQRARARDAAAHYQRWRAGQALPLDDVSMDVIWAGEVIEHVTDTAAWLSELRRVLRSGGRLLLSTPYHGRVKGALLAATAFERHFDPRGQHVRFYTPRSLRVLLDDFGFESVQLTAAGGLPLLRDVLLAEATRAGLAFPGR